MGDLLERLEKAKTGFDVDAVADLSAPPAAAAVAGASAALGPSAADAPPPGAGRRRGRGGAISSESMAMASSGAAPFKVTTVKKDDESRERIENAVAGNILFSHLDDTDRDTLVDAMAPKTFAPGSTIIQQGDDGDFFYIVDSGDCDVYVAKGNKPASHVSTIGRGGGFGELALMYNCPRAATIKAKTQVETFTLDRNTFQVPILLCLLLPRSANAALSPPPYLDACCLL
jgi:cAMP-dependent protein kinase regulator